MEKHVVLQILQDLNINDVSDVKPRILEIDKGVAGNLLSKMDEWYKHQQLQMQASKVSGDSIFDIWVPSTSDSGINKVSSNLLFANSLTLSDPLYDYLCHLESDFSAKYSLVSQSMHKGTNREGHICADCLKQFDPMFENHVKGKLETIFTFYLRSKPLIESKKLIPYVDISPRERPILDTPFLDVIRKYDIERDEYITKFESARDYFVKITGEGHFINEISKPYIPQWIDIAILDWTALVGIDEVLSTNYISSPSIDFLGHTSFEMFRAFFKLLLDFCSTLTTE